MHNCLPNPSDDCQKSFADRDLQLCIQSQFFFVRCMHNVARTLSPSPPTRRLPHRPIRPQPTPNPIRLLLIIPFLPLVLLMLIRCSSSSNPCHPRSSAPKSSAPLRALLDFVFPSPPSASACYDDWHFQLRGTHSC